MSKQKYYLVYVSLPPGPDDDMEHGQMFQLIMTEEEFEMAEILEGLKKGEDYHEEYPYWCNLKKLCKVTKEEYKKFRPILQMSYSEQLMNDIHSKLEEKDDRRNKKKKGKQDRSRKKEKNYCLVNVDAQGWDDRNNWDTEFFVMMTEEELQAAKVLEKKKASGDGDEIEQLFYPGEVDIVCTVTRQEYKKFSKLLKGEFSEEFFGEVQVQMAREEDEEINRKRRKKHSMTVESEGEDNDDNEEDEHSGIEEEDDEEILEAHTRKKIRS